MRVDFYQLGASGHDGVVGSIAGKVLAEEQRLLIVADDEALLARLDRILWDEGAASFLPHGIAGGADDSRQPILLSTTTDAPNLARNILIADGEWRDAALHFDRAFYLFGTATLDGSRLAWKLLAGRAEVERHYWANQDGKWVEKG